MPYIIRLDDACEKRDIEKWNRMETLLDQYGIIPLVGVIPHCEDKTMEKYPYDENFWQLTQKWVAKGWVVALHGYNHVYMSKSGGINPVNSRSEFAGVPLEVQKQKITDGIKIMESHGVFPEVFFAPSHTFDGNTLTALRECSDIRIISDTIANDIYYSNGFTFVPQQSGRVRHLPFKYVTFCYHPNVMSDEMYVQLEKFLMKNKDRFVPFPRNIQEKRKLAIYDRLLMFFYFSVQRFRK